MGDAYVSALLLRDLNDNIDFYVGGSSAWGTTTIPNVEKYKFFICHHCREFTHREASQPDWIYY